MSITLWIENDTEETVQAVYECQCVQEGKAWDECFSCKGTGKVEIKGSSFEMNLSNGNFFEFLRTIRLKEVMDYCGDIDPKLLLDHLDKWGFHAEERYVDASRKIAEEAIKRGEKLVWG
jgi:hypothetical protein